MKITGTFEYIKHYIILIVLFTIFLKETMEKEHMQWSLLKEILHPYQNF